MACAHNILISTQGAHLIEGAWPTTHGPGRVDHAVWVVRLIDAGHTPEHAEDCAAQLPAGHTASARALGLAWPYRIAPDVEVPAPDPPRRRCCTVPRPQASAVSRRVDDQALGTFARWRRRSPRRAWRAPQALLAPGAGVLRALALLSDKHTVGVTARRSGEQLHVATSAEPILLKEIEAAGVALPDDKS
jgi:hypothetical protein